MQPLILIVEDEFSQVEMLGYNLRAAGYQIIFADNGETGLLLAVEEQPDLVILDWMLPEISGIEVCRQLRGNKITRDIPIIMVTAKGEEQDMLSGLDTGADDYIVKPYSPKELISRIRAVLRRAIADSAGDMLVFADITLDPIAHKVRRNDKPVHLGPKEFGLLQVLLRRPGQVYTRAQLLDLVWGREAYVEERTVDVHIRRLRKALNENGQDVIRTVRGAGYAADVSS